MRERNVKITMIEKLLNHVAPHPCFVCGEINANFCSYCKYDIESESFFGCIVCGEASRGGVCDQHGESYVRAWVVGERRAGLRRLIDAYKFERASALSSALASLLDVRLPYLPPSTIVVPVPSRSSQIRKRGYDHTLLVAGAFARLRNLDLRQPFEAVSHISQHETESKTERQEQARSAFRLIGPIDSTRPYIVIDDVVTTGATLSVLGGLLAEAGVSERWVAALARQPLD